MSTTTKNRLDHKLPTLSDTQNLGLEKHDQQDDCNANNYSKQIILNDPYILLN